MKLSICIPTYNRKQKLTELLDSIICQISQDIQEDVEIVISDNCSNDGTDKFVESLASNNRDIRIVYHKNKTNLGADRNYVNAVKLAGGEYAWIIGSDDKLRSGAIKRALNEIAEKHSVYFSNRVSYNVDFTKCFGIDYFFNKKMPSTKTIVLNSDDDWNTFFNCCNSIGGVCSYLSSFFFDREMFLDAENYEEYIGTAYVHVYMVLRGLQKKNHPSVKIIKEPFVMCRLGMDSFFVNNYQRRMLDFNGYISISRIFKDPFVRESFLSIVYRTHPFFPVKMLVTMNGRERKNFLRVLRITGYPDEYIEFISRLSRHKLAAILLYLDRLLPSLKK